MTHDMTHDNMTYNNMTCDMRNDDMCTNDDNMSTNDDDLAANAVERAVERAVDNAVGYDDKDDVSVEECQEKDSSDTYNGSMDHINTPMECHSNDTSNDSSGIAVMK